MAKATAHYTKSGTLYTGKTHKMKGGAVHTGATHSSTSKPVFHMKDLPAKTRAIIKKKGK
jgi:hypothetical protein